MLMNAKLHEAFKAVQSLPVAAQEAIALEVLQEVSHYEGSTLSSEQLKLVRERLSRPFEIAGEADVTRIVGKL
jgi:hypothetical protein